MSSPALVAGGRSTRPTTVPGSLRPRRRPWLLLAGLLSMVVSAAAFAVLYLGADAREQVLVVARPVAAGQALSAADLRVARVVPDAGVEVVPAGQLAQTLGRPAAVPLVPGALLAGPQLGPAAWPAAGQVVVAVPVKPGRLASGITAGAQVLVIQVAADATGTGAGAAAGDAAGAPRTPAAGGRAGRAPVAGTVVAVADAVDVPGGAVVSLLLPQADAVAVAGSAGDLSLALVRG